MDRAVYVVSDIHLGPGQLPRRRPDEEPQWDDLEDFVSDQEFAQFLDRIGRGPQPVELVIAGDFLEYPQTLPELGPKSPDDNLGTTEAESVLRTRVILGQRPDIASGHPEVFKALRRFMVEGNSITIIVGNHDIDLLWDEVWALVFDTIYPPGAAGDLRLVRYDYVVGSGPSGRVYIEHGHEHDPANRFGDRMTQPFGIDRTGTRRLKRCWGTLFVDKVYNELERERWFIDNVKPIPRVIQLGLRNDFRFTATALGLVARFLITSGLPPITIFGGSEEALGGAGDAPPPTADELLGALGDEELRAHLAAQLEDPAFRAEFESAAAGISPDEWGMVQAGVATPVSLDVASGDQGGVSVTQGGEVILGGGAGEESAYRRAARALMENDPSVTTVIMGHTHGPIDGYVDPIDLPDGRTGYYFNSGTWTRHLKDERQPGYSWAEIADDDNYTASFTYIRLDPDGQGGYRASLGSWAGR